MFAISLLVTGAVFTLHMERINIADIIISGNSTITTKTLKEFAQEKISKNYLFVFPKSSIFLYPRKDMQASLLKKFNAIKKVDISFESLRSIFINIEERKPYALYCGEYGSVGDCYFLDEEGFVFTKAPDFSGNVFLKYYGKKISVGERFMPARGFQEINFFISSLSDIGLNAATFSIVDGNDYEIGLEKGGKILFGQKQNLSNIFNNIQSVFDSDEFNKDNLSNLDYADFRFGNKVYFKFLLQ